MVGLVRVAEVAAVEKHELRAPPHLVDLRRTEQDPRSGIAVGRGGADDHSRAVVVGPVEHAMPRKVQHPVIVGEERPDNRCGVDVRGL